MNYPNNTKKQLFYYIPETKQYNFIPLGFMLSTNHNILFFDTMDEWKNHINNTLGTDSWLSAELLSSIDSSNTIDIGNISYITKQGYRLPFNDNNATQEYLTNLLSMNQPIVKFMILQNNTVSLNYHDFKDMVDQYVQDKPLLLQTLNSLNIG